MINSQKQAIMFARVDEWKKSGKTMREFASGIGVSKSCFEYWIRKKRDLTASSIYFFYKRTFDKSNSFYRKMVILPSLHDLRIMILFSAEKKRNVKGRA